MHSQYLEDGKSPYSPARSLPLPLHLGSGGAGERDVEGGSQVLRLRLDTNHDGREKASGCGHLSDYCADAGAAGGLLSRQARHETRPEDTAGVTSQWTQRM